MAFTDKLADRLGEPLHLNVMSLFVAAFGSFKAKVAFDLISRRPYAFGVLDGVTQALKHGRAERFYALEFGVAGGAGLRSMMRICDEVAAIAGVEVKAIGFDTGAGLPPPRDYRDHPELWQAGDYPPCERLPNVVYGDIADTAARTFSELDGQLCFASVDVDYYSSAAACLRPFASAPVDVLPPYLPIYFDDIMQRPNNPFAGELLAISEFNEHCASRKLAPIQGLRNKRIMKRVNWPDQMYYLHAFDHPRRQPA